MHPAHAAASRHDLPQRRNAARLHAAEPAAPDAATTATAARAAKPAAAIAELAVQRISFGERCRRAWFIAFRARKRTFAGADAMFIEQ